MNLDELKIKVSIDLDDFNKQLSAITKGIDKAFGPKATKKIMQANHKIIKKESAEINKTLNQAFELDFAKFNTNLNKAMNQAKRTVQQTCREIRSEINSAFDIKGTVRITGKASVSNSSSSQRSAESAAIVQSSQYTGAMINKAVNEMIRTNNANTTRIETAIGNLANRLAKVISDNKPVPTSDRNNTAIGRGAVSERDIKANTIIETSFKVIDDELQSIVNKAINAINVPKLEAPIDAKLITKTSEIQDAVDQVVQYVQSPEIYAPLSVLDSGVQEQLDDIVSSINISDLIVELTAEAYNIKDEVDDIVGSIDIPEIIVNVLAEDNDVQEIVNDIAESVNIPEIVINVTAEDDNVQGKVDEVAESVDVPDVTINITAEDDDVQGKVDNIAESINAPEIAINVTTEDDGVQGKVDDIAESIDVPEVAINITAEDDDVQGIIDNIAESVNVPEVIISVSAEDNNIQSEIDSLVDFIDVPELVVQLTVEDADIQNEVNKIIRGIDVPELTANIELLDTGIQNEANKTVKSIFVPELLSELRIEAKDLQNEVNKILGNINVPVLIADISLLYSDVQGQIDKAIKNVDVPKIPVLFEINQTELQSRLNSVASELRLPKIALPVSVARPKTKDDNKATSKSKIVKKTIETPEQTAVDVPVNVTGEEEVSELEKKLLECGKAVKDLRKNFISIKGSKDGLEEKIESLKKLQQEVLEIGAGSFIFRATFDFDDNKLNGIAKSVKEDLSNVGLAIENEVDNLKSKLGKGLDDATDELSFTSDSDDMFTQMSDIVDKEIEEIKGKLKHLNMMYKSLFSRPVISKSLKFDLNVANKELAETFNNIEAVKKFLDTFAGSYGTEMDTSILEQDPEIKPSLIIDDNESFSDFGKRVEDEIDDIQDKLKDLSRQYSSLFDNEYISTTFSYDSDLANKALREVINTIGELKVSMESLNEYQGFQNKFEAPEPAGVPMVASDALNEPFKAIADDIDNAHNKITELRKAVEELFNLFRMPIEARFSKTIGDVEQLKNEISNLLAMLEFGPGLEGFRKQIEANSEQIDDAIEKIFDSLKTPFAFSPSVFKEIATLHKAIEDISGSEPGLELKALKALEDLDAAVLEEVARLEKEIAEDEARRTLIIAELEKRFEHLKEDLVDIRDMTAEEFEANFDLDGAKEDIIEARQELIEFRDAFKEINRNSDIEINVKAVRDCISLMEKLQTKIDKIQASKIVPEEVDIPEVKAEETPKPEKIKASKPEKIKEPKPEKVKEPKPEKPENLLALEKQIKIIKEDLFDLRALSDEEFELNYDLDDSKKKLEMIKELLLDAREQFKEFNGNNELQFNLKPVRDCISLIDKLQVKINKIEASKITPEVQIEEPEDLEIPEVDIPEPIDEDLLKAAEAILEIEKQIAENEARRTLIIAEIEKRYKNLKEELTDIKDMTAEEFEAEFDLDESKENLAQYRQELLKFRDAFKEINQNSDIQIDLKPIRDCLSLVEKLKTKIDKIQSSKIVPEEVEIPEPEIVETPEPIDEDLLKAAQQMLNLEEEIAEGEAKRSLIIAELERRYKSLKEELIDIRSMSDEDFKADFDINEGDLNDTREELSGIKQELLLVRELFKDIKNNTDIKVDLKTVRDCISLIEKIQAKIDKIEASKVVPEVQIEEPKMKAIELHGFKLNLQDIQDQLRGLELTDEIELNLGIDQLKEQLQGLTSLENLDIDLDDLRRDIVLLLEEIDKVRSKSEEEIVIKVINDEVDKIVDLLKLVDELREQSKINIDIDADTSDAENALEKISDMQDDIRNKFKTPYGAGSGLFSTTPGGPVGGGSGGNGGGRIVSSGNFTTPPKPPKPDFDIEETGMDFNAHVRAFNMAKLIDKFKDMSSKIKKIMGDVSNTIKSKLKGAITGALGKLASASKSMWSKITGIFRKGAKDSANATNTLGSTIKDLARQFFSLYALWNGAKMAIQSAENLIQGEQKLATVMKNRMKATDESVRAIRDLIDAQQQLGVVGKEVQYNAAQQLSVFLQSSKALQTLIPSMNDLIAQQYGANATLEEGAEVARKVGQAIVEGEFTELQESTGITLSEAEIEKFRNLRTEEERAAMLADILADRIGNMNEELANTPYGAISQLKNNFMELLGTVGTFIVNAIKPLVQWLNLVVVACTKAIKAFGAFFGFSFDATSLGLTGGGSPSEGMDDTKESIDEATEAAEKFKGSLMGFDEINILSDNTNKSENTPPTTDGSIAVGDGELTPDTGGLDLMSDKMKKFLDEVLEPFKKAWDLLGDRWIAAWERLKEKFKEFCDSLAKFLKSVWDNGGKEFVQHMAEIALAVGIAAMEIGGTILDALAKLWEHLDPEKNMHTQRLLDVLNEVSVKLRDFILGLNEHLENLLKYGGQEVLNAMGDCFMDLAAAAVNTFGVIIDAVDGLIDHLDPKFNQDTRNMLQATADMFHAVGQAAWDFSELLKSALANGGQDMINAFGTCVVNLGETAARVITTMMESFSKFFDYIDPAKNEITKNMMKAWEDAFYAIGDAALQFATLFESIMDNGGQEVLNKLGDAFNSLVGLVGDAVKEIADALNGLFEHLDPKTNEFTQGMLKAWQDAFDGISEMCEKISDVLSSVMDNGGQALLNSLGDLAMQIGETFGNIVEEVADCVGQLFEHLDPGKNKVAKGAIDAFKYFVDSIRNFVEMLGDALGTFMDNGGQEFINNVGDIVALLLDLGATIGGDIINAISTFFDSWAGHVVISTCATALELISEVLEGLLRILEPLSPVISAVVTAIGGFLVAQKVVGFIEGIVGAFKLLSGAGGALALAKAGFSALWGIILANPIAATVAAITGVITILVALYNKCESFRELADKVLEGFKGAFDKIKEHCSKLLENIREIFGSVIDIITGIFEGDGYKVGEAVRNLITNVLELIYNLHQSFVEIGWELIKGLVKGIWECIKNLPSLLAGFCEFVVDFFKGLFGIHSPSTVFAELGVNLIEGLIEGIMSMFEAIGETITLLVDSILEAFNGIGEKLSEIWESIKDSASELWNNIKDAIVDKCKETYDNVKEKYENIKKTVSDKLEELKEKSSDAWTKIKEKTSDLVSKMKDDAEDKYSKLKDKLTTTMEDWRKNSEDKWNKIKEKTASLVDTLKKNAEEKYNKMKDALTTTMENWRQKSEEKWTNIKNKTTELAENLKTTVEDKYNKFKEKLTSTLENLRNTSQEKWTNIKDKTTELAENLKSTVEDKYNKFKDNLTTTLENWRQNSEEKWNAIKEKTSSLVENLRTTVEDKYNTLKTNLASKMSEIKSNIETKWGEIKTNAINKASEVVTNVTTKYGELKTNVTNKMAEVKSNAKTKWDEIKTDAKSGAEGMVKKAGEGLSGLSKTLTDAINKAKTAASDAWDKVKNIFSGKINMPKLPKLEVKWETFSSSWFPEMKIPRLSWNARGGIIDGITPLGFAGGALQMGGEAGKELVVPLENTSFTSKIAQAIGQAVDNTLAKQSNPYNNNNNNTNDNRDIVLKVNEREFARASINSINRLQAESGRTLLNI